jgi:phosphoglycerate dehydrogenase-like enzyme
VLALSALKPKAFPMRYRCAVLDDYQNVALKMADWSRVTGDADVTVFNERLGDEAAVARALQGFGIVCLMRERTPFPRSLIEKLPDLKLIVTTGLKNASIDVAAAKERGILVCGTEGAKHPTAELAIGLMIDLARHISEENARMRRARPGRPASAPISSAIRLASSGSAISASGSRRWVRHSA